MFEEWTRPALQPPQYPSVWWEFTARDSDSDEVVNYRVQDLPEDRFDDVVQFFLDYFIPDENTCRLKDLQNYPDAIQEITPIWQTALAQKVSLVCFKEGSDEIIGCNILAIQTHAEKDSLPIPEHQPWLDICKTLDVLNSAVDVFQKYNVNHYMMAFGVSVAPKYRGRGIATEILKARYPLCTSLGVPLTSTVFTGVPSIKAAERAGFQLDATVTYEELETKHGLVYPGNQEYALKLMSIQIT